MKITPYKNRKLNKNIPIKIYRNLNKKGKTYSIKQNNLVIGYTNNITLKNCILTVSTKGRQRTIKTQQRNVHAFIQGYLTEQTPKQTLNTIHYNPYKNNTFIDNNNNPLTKANYIYIKEGVVYYE